MNKSFIYMAIAIVGILTSCNKSGMDTITKEPSGIKVLLTVNDALWTGDDNKTSFTAGTGIGFTGDEHLSLYYADDHFDGNIEAEPTGVSGQYSFTMPAAAEDCHWYGIMPYSDTYEYNGYASAVRVNLSAVQYPGVNTFDPRYDYLVAQPFDVSGTEGDETAEISSFKRLFAPFCLNITGLDPGEKIYNAAIQLSQAATADNALAGSFDITMSDTYAETSATVVSATMTNDMSAVYEDGLSAIDGKWPVWLMVNPMTINAGCSLTVSVSTASNVYKRTVELPRESTFKTDAVNRLTFNIKKDDDYEDITNDYYAQYQAGRDITINGTVFNKVTNGDARLLKLYNLTNANQIIADYTSNGILFLDYDEADGKDDQLDISGFWLQPNNIVIIGRYRNHQPYIHLVNRGMNPKGSEIHLKNVKFSTNQPIYTSQLSSNLNFNAEDCTIVAESNYLFCENQTSYGFGNIVINNSIIKITRSLYEVQGTAQIPSGSNLVIEKFWLTNSVVYAGSNVIYSTVNLRPNTSTVWYSPNLDLKFDQNTFYNLANNNTGLVALGNMTKLNITRCVGDATLSNYGILVNLHAQLTTPVEDSAVRRNQFNDRGAAKDWKYFWSIVGNSGVMASAFNGTKGVDPFLSADTDTGHFPINREVVTGDYVQAGASYNTKYWKTWK